MFLKWIRLLGTFVTLERQSIEPELHARQEPSWRETIPDPSHGDVLIVECEKLQYAIFVAL